ncbi:hypothetical protein BCR33DRAFT_338344 [Rhizoclosmatium globosum]|uniref:Uncharacterized protein n=1 Tax=Rhizoclosmatium globosum TaxID=329046 RepID=A0A1Y2C4A3_9FUNG|nr:hypothetical protein BCR33DRAFT_338344 [Rhizoclosmatium globosum]|eukprot:ORY41714.1 hypothetical protein BCR33DRAFT_338344 [Rhizoclosmatium globosum]
MTAPSLSGRFLLISSSRSNATTSAYRLLLRSHGQDKSHNQRDSSTSTTQSQQFEQMTNHLAPSMEAVKSIPSLKDSSDLVEQLFEEFTERILADDEATRQAKVVEFNATLNQLYSRCKDQEDQTKVSNGILSLEAHFVKSSYGWQSK